MKNRKFHLVTALLILTSAVRFAVAADVTVFFSPRGGIPTAIATEINNAQTTVLIMSYSISESQICQSIIDAHHRGLDVRMIVTRSQESPVQSKAGKLHTAGVTIKTDRKHKLMHHKVVICDDHLVITGSANHSRAADRDNAENIVVIKDQVVAELFTKQFETLWEISRPFKPIKRKVRKRFTPDRSPLSPAKRPRRKEPISWHLLQDPSTQTMRVAALQTHWSLQNGRGGITSANSSRRKTRSRLNKPACA
jgi:phosphatidylserine/phosphatidylglycerophosphate/cardiolipin synthase-like enzyme